MYNLGGNPTSNFKNRSARREDDLTLQAQLLPKLYDERSNNCLILSIKDSEIKQVFENFGAN